jgi:hypothetical protein
MKRLVLLGEGKGEVSGLPVLARKLLADKKGEDQLFIDYDVIRAHNADGVVRWDKKANCLNFSQWHRYLRYATYRKNLGAVLTIFDGDSKTFPAGTKDPFCAARAAKTMASVARGVGAGKTFSLAVVFACVEYETWLVAGCGQQPVEGSAVLFPGKEFPPGNPESHGKGWIERNYGPYQPTLHQKPFTELLNLQVVREKQVRSFSRLEHALEQLLEAMKTGKHVCSPFDERDHLSPQ